MLNLLDLIACCYVNFITFASWFCLFVLGALRFVCIVECLVSGLCLYFDLGCTTVLFAFWCCLCLVVFAFGLVFAILNDLPL